MNLTTGCWGPPGVSGPSDYGSADNLSGSEETLKLVPAEGCM